MPMEQPFMVSLKPHARLKLTAKPKALDGQFVAKIVSPFLTHINKKLEPAGQIGLEGLESCVVSTAAGAVTAAYFTSEDVPFLTLTNTVSSVVPEDAVGAVLHVELTPRTTRAFKIVCSGVTLSANLPAQHVHLPLHETVVKQFLMQYNDKVNSERKGAKSSVTLKEVLHFKIGDTEIDIEKPVCQLLPCEGETVIVMTLDPTAYDKWGYDNPKAAASPPQLKAAFSVFVVRCGVVELKLTLPDKSLDKSLQDGVLVPFLGAYAKKAQRATCTMTDVLRVEVDGLSVAPSLKVRSVVRPPDTDAQRPIVDEADDEAYLAAVDAAKARGASDAELGEMSRRYLAASHEREKGVPAPVRPAPGPPPPTRVEIFLRPSPEAGATSARTATPAAIAATSAAAAPAKDPKAPKPNVDYSKWGRLEDSDSEDEASELAKAETAAASAMAIADAAAATALAEAGGSVQAISEAAKAPVQAKVAAAEAAKARAASLREAMAAKEAAKASAARQEAAAKAAAVRAPSTRTVTRRKWDDWDKVKLDLSDDDDDDDAKAKEKDVKAVNLS
jgi:hypothetical protein